MISSSLNKKIHSSLNLLHSIQNSKPNEIIEIAYSGGKDSDVILQLAKEAGINFKAIYKNTTIDPPGTISHVLNMGVTILQPKKTFRHLIQEKGFPHRFRRFCCAELKEYKVLDTCIQGIRKSESVKRNALYSEPVVCRFYNKSDHVNTIYPILDWSLYDVSNFLQDRGITCAPLYYDDNGLFHAERRLGCLCCPLASKHNRLLEFKKYPGMVRFYIHAAEKYFNSHSSKMLDYDSPIEWFCRDVFYSSQLDWRLSKYGFFGTPDYKSLLQDYFKIYL